jgi:anaerobic magnesium-protoporphyrin IX monomethyl ester cyclase
LSAPAPRVLVIRSPQVLSYFNAGHHLGLYQVAGHLRAHFPSARVDCLDPTVETITWKDIADLLLSGNFHLVAIQNDLDGIDGLDRLVAYARAISPRSRLITFGRLSVTAPRYFRGTDLDAVVESGDAEAGVEEFLRSVLRRRVEPLAGVAVRAEGGWRDAAGVGSFLAPSEWHLPDPSELPYERYDDLYADDGRRFSGLPGQRELVVPVARGCPMGCDFCEVPALGGSRERRLSVDETLRYIEDCAARASFDYVSFYAPTFTLMRRWVTDLCTKLTLAPQRLPWKCCTTLHHLDEQLLAEMAAAGCVRISVGLETLDEGGHAALPPAKRKARSDLESLAAWCIEVGIELNCFVIIGLPGTNIAGVEATMRTVVDLGGRVRPTIYAPGTERAGLSSADEVAALSRQILPSALPLDEDERQRAYALAFGALESALG